MKIPPPRAIASHPTASRWLDDAGHERKLAHHERSHRIVEAYGYEQANALVAAAVALSPEATTEEIVWALWNSLNPMRTQEVSDAPA